MYIKQTNKKINVRIITMNAFKNNVGTNRPDKFRVSFDSNGAGNNKKPKNKRNKINNILNVRFKKKKTPAKNYLPSLIPHNLHETSCYTYS